MLLSSIMSNVATCCNIVPRSSTGLVVYRKAAIAVILSMSRPGWLGGWWRVAWAVVLANLSMLVVVTIWGQESSRLD